MSLQRGRRVRDWEEKGCVRGGSGGRGDGDSVGVGVIAMIYGVSDRWGSANGRVGGVAFGDSRIDFRTPNVITYKTICTS